MNINQGKHLRHSLSNYYKFFVWNWIIEFNLISKKMNTRF